MLEDGKRLTTKLRAIRRNCMLNRMISILQFLASDFFTTFRCENRLQLVHPLPSKRSCNKSELMAHNFEIFTKQNRKSSKLPRIKNMNLILLVLLFASEGEYVDEGAEAGIKVIPFLPSSSLRDGVPAVWQKKALDQQGLLSSGYIDDIKEEPAVGNGKRTLCLSKLKIQLLTTQIGSSYI